MDIKRVIPVLLLRGTGLVKTVRFSQPIYLGDAINTIWLFSQKMADEIIVLDIDATPKSKKPNFELIERLATQCFMPLAYGGGIRTIDDATKLFHSGVEKVVLNTSAIDSPSLVSSIANRFGSQAVVVSIDVATFGGQLRTRRPSDGSFIEMSPIDLALRAQRDGAGEILVQDADRDGTKAGYNLELFKQFTTLLDVPVIALGGAKDEKDLELVVQHANASAAAAGSIFVFAGRRNAVLISMPELGSSESYIPNGHEQLLTAPAAPSLNPPNPYTKMCSLTVLDDTDPDFKLDQGGVCHLARKAIARLESNRLTGAPGRAKISEIVERAKSEGRGKQYDCLIGLSGGVDSSYVAMMVKELGLRPLAIHLDNGWNSNTAVLNIKRIVDILDIDLHTYVINWDDMRDLQRAFFKASLPDVELLTDHAIIASSYKLAAKHGIRTLIFGVNITTESIMPEAWSYTKRDAAHIQSVHRAFGERKLTNFPLIHPWDFARYKYVNGIHYESLLSYIEFDKQSAIQQMRDKLNYVPYPRKHGESKFTQFYQEYYLPVKFGFDKRKGHLSSLIIAGQLTREQALNELNQPLYTDPSKLERDIEYVRRKLQFTNSEWQEIMSSRPISHDMYPGYYTRLKQIRRFLKSFRPTH
jgi:imidazoleglycerol phosphate synthase cyclase subunit